MDFEYLVEEETIPITIDKKGDTLEVKMDDKTFAVDAVSINENTVHFMIGSEAYVGYAASNEEDVFVYFNGKQYQFKDGYCVDKSAVVIEDVVEGKQTTVAILLLLRGFPCTITTGRRNPGPEPEGSESSAHQTSPCAKSTTRFAPICVALRR